MEPTIKMIQTVQGDDVKWRNLGEQELRDYFSFRMDTVVVDSSQEFQTHLGFGGAFTEAAAYVMENASEEARKEILKAYFNKETGLAYNLGRTSINGCDFSLEPYTYVEDEDVELKTFHMEREDKYVVPFIKQASEEAGEDIGILCAPWSPPAFMKNNKDMNHGGRLLRKYYGTWAKYMVKYVKGIAYHWYGSDKSEILTMAHEIYPKQHLIFTEGCVELVNNSGNTSSKAGIGAWKHGEIYGHNMINDFNNYTEGWIDWNLVLDEKGGPNYVGNYCEAPIMLNTETNEVIYNISYYYIGHFSKYIKPGAKRILCLNDSDKGIYSVAYKNPNGQIIVVVQNELSKRHRLAVTVDGKGINTEVPAHSITTFIVDK